jgi:hypothetical protein
MRDSRSTWLDRRASLLRLYAAFGGLVGLASLTYVVLAQTIGSLSEPQVLVAAIGAAAAIAGAAAYVWVDIYRLRARQELRLGPEATVPPFTFLQAWTDLEQALRNAGRTAIGDSSTAQPLSVLVDRLLDAELINRDTVEELKRITGLRNDLVHGRTALDIDWRKETSTARNIAEALRTTASYASRR